MNFVDEFVIYDDIQFSKGGWIHRNRYLNNGVDKFFTLPLKRDSDYLDVRDREISESWKIEGPRIARKIHSAYAKAPFFEEGLELVRQCFRTDSSNLFDFVFQSIHVVSSLLEINTKLHVSSELSNTRHLKGQDRVLALCQDLDASEYINFVNGQALYHSSAFDEIGVSLRFHRIEEIEYPQFIHEFVPNLSIVDVVMFNGIAGTRKLLSSFSLE